MYDDPSTKGIDCAKNFYRFDPDTCTMDSAGSFGEACSTRIDWVLDHWPITGTKGIMLDLTVDESGLTSGETSVVGGHPDLGLQQGPFVLELISAAGDVLEEFAVWDPRIELGLELAYTPKRDFVLIVPWRQSLKAVRLWHRDAPNLDLTIDVTGTINAYCQDEQIDQPECRGQEAEPTGFVLTRELLTGYT